MASAAIAEHFRGPWPDGRELLRRELDSYTGDLENGALDELATRCEPWTVHDVTAHLAATFQRFGAMLAQGRDGNFTPPFAPEELDAENLRAVAEFGGDPLGELIAAADAFLAEVGDLDEPIPHQAGTLPVGLNVLFGLLDVSAHHDDVLDATHRRYRPAPETVGALLPMAERMFGMPPDVEDPWAVMIAGSGRTPL